MIAIAAAGFGLYATQAPTTLTETSTSTTTATLTGPFTVNLAYKAGTGFYLTNATGFTLYFRETDHGNGTSTCTGGCVTAWPLFYAAPGTITLPPGMGASSFGVATRTDGLKQTTYNGYPLYYFANDKASGQIAGQGKGNFYPCCSVDAPATPP
jgi:predicted lipoprotein with Yx(FWY)xxD motif